MPKDDFFKQYQHIVIHYSTAVNESGVASRVVDCANLPPSAIIGPPQQGSHVKIFVISLRSAKVRRAEASEQMAKCGVAFEFFDAVEGAAGHSDWFAGIDHRLFQLNTRRYDPTPGEIGCYASHLSLWKWAITHDRPVVILEDDFQLEPGFAEIINGLEPLVNEFGFIRLQSMHGPRALFKRLRPPAREVLRRNGLSVHYLSDPPLYALAYAISPEAARTLTGASPTLFAPVDKFLQHTWIHETPIYALSPELVTMSAQAELSTIGGRRDKSVNPFVLLGRAIYKGIGEFRRYCFDRKQFARMSRSARPQSGKSK